MASADDDGFDAVASEFFRSGGAGLNVTVPCQRIAFRWVDDLSEPAEQAGAVHAAIRASLQAQETGAASDVNILYGGSVKPDNAEVLMGQPNVDGALVGGASLKPELFIPIIDAARKLSA